MDREFLGHMPLKAVVCRELHSDPGVVVHIRQGEYEEFINESRLRKKTQFIRYQLGLKECIFGLHVPSCMYCTFRNQWRILDG